MEEYEPINLVQQVQKGNDQFDFEKFSILLTRLNGEQFNKFCRAIRRLTEFYDINIGTIRTEDPENIENRNEVYKLDKLDGETSEIL